MSEMCKPYEAPKLEYIQVMKNDMAPWEIGDVHRILARASNTSEHYFIYQGEDKPNRIYRASACRLITKQVYDLIASRIPMSVFHDTPPSDESRPEIVRVHQEARAMYETPWVDYHTGKCVSKKLTFTTTIDRETHLEHEPLVIDAIIHITKESEYDEYETHEGNYVAVYGYYENEPNKCEAFLIKGDHNAKYYMSLEVAMQETKDQILSYWFNINPTRKESF